MSLTREVALKKIAETPLGQKRAELLKNDDFRNLLLSSGANVTLYCGTPHNAKTAKDALSNVYIGLIQRKNKKGRLDGLGALGGLAERTPESYFNQLSDLDKINLLKSKDDIVLDGAHPVLTKDINIIRKNNVLREMREELDDLGITDVSINPTKLVLIPMPHVRDDNYMINIWDGHGECYAITPYCHIYEDTTGLIDKISSHALEKDGGEAVCFKKIPLFDALSAYGHIGTSDCSLEDGRNAAKDYRYPHEYLASWGLAAKLFEYQSQRMIALAQEVQASSSHLISFSRIAKATGQKMEDIAAILHIDANTLQQMEQIMNNVFTSGSLTPKSNDYSK